MCDVRRGGEYRTYEEDADGVEGGICEDERQHGLEGLRGRRAEQVDGIGAAALGRQDRPQRLGRRTRGSGQHQALACACVGKEDAEAAGIRHDGDIGAERERLRREQSGGIEEFRKGLDAEDTGLMKERIDGRVRTRERCRVRGGRTCPRFRRAAFERQHGLPPRHPAGDATEAERIAEALEIQGHDRGVPIVFPVLQQVIGAHVGLVTERHEVRETESARTGLLHDGEAERPALGGESHIAGRKRAGGERGVELCADEATPRQFGPMRRPP